LVPLVGRLSRLLIKLIVRVGKFLLCGRHGIPEEVLPPYKHVYVVGLGHLSRSYWLAEVVRIHELFSQELHLKPDANRGACLIRLLSLLHTVAKECPIFATVQVFSQKEQQVRIEFK
jgi:hypothetical protein